jgi:hypothetical protein
MSDGGGRLPALGKRARQIEDAGFAGVTHLNRAPGGSLQAYAGVARAKA